MSFGANVRARRTAEEISLNDFAKRIGVSPAYWSRIELEKENPPRDAYVEKAAAILGVRMDDLFITAGRLPPDMRSDLNKVGGSIDRDNWRRRKSLADVAASDKYE